MKSASLSLNALLPQLFWCTSTKSTHLCLMGHVISLAQHLQFLFLLFSALFHVRKMAPPFFSKRSADYTLHPSKRRTYFFFPEINLTWTGSVLGVYQDLSHTGKSERKFNQACKSIKICGFAAIWWVCAPGSRLPLLTWRHPASSAAVYKGIITTNCLGSFS